MRLHWDVTVEVQERKVTVSGGACRISAMVVAAQIGEALERGGVQFTFEGGVGPGEKSGRHWLTIDRAVDYRRLVDLLATWLIVLDTADRLPALEL